MTHDVAPPYDPENPQERRLIMRFYRLWAERAAGRPCPTLTDLTRTDLLPFKDHTILIDLQDGYDKPKLRVIGAHIMEQLDGDLLGADPATAPRGSILSRVTDHYLEVLANQAPVAFEAEFMLREGWDILYRAILTPLSHRDDRVDFVMGVINWKRAEPVADKARSLPFPANDSAEDSPPEQHDPYAPQDIETAMADRVYHLRDRALAAGRSRRELYDLLVDIYGFWQWTAADAAVAAAYAGVLAQDGLKAQRRAPFTALLKLVFGPTYDKTRLTEYAAALAHAQRQDWSDQKLAAALTTDGGMKAMVRAERQARAPAPKPVDDVTAAARRLPVLATLDLPEALAGQIPPHGLVVLVATTQGDQGIKIVAAADADSAALRPVVRRLLRQNSVTDNS